MGRSDGFGVVKYVRWDQSPTEFLAVMLLTLICIGICWLLRAYITKHLRAQIGGIEIKLRELESR